ncbi:hypothetical protein PHLCEN_2v10468 [Hermanssonia centrifuga]|uniref:Uncharacterized protein n=1 Tax=Hermanssonia centrifuga TaxID=98765 RepID=A0A2R6NMD8_9APHY|nr:hypothetical protein PHLCEN_2v10468 [Hermanssonia centrifuga]
MAPFPQMQAECPHAVSTTSTVPITTVLEVDAVSNLLVFAGGTGVLLYTIYSKLSPQANLDKAAALLRETEAIIEDIRKQDGYHSLVINNSASRCVPFDKLEQDLEEYVICFIAQITAQYPIPYHSCKHEYNANLKAISERGWIAHFRELFNALNKLRGLVRQCLNARNDALTTSTTIYKEKKAGKQRLEQQKAERLAEINSWSEETDSLGLFEFQQPGTGMAAQPSLNELD